MMIRAMFLSLAMVAAFAPAAAPAQQRHSTQWRTKSADEDRIKAASVDAAQQFAEYSQCVVRNRYDRARALALAPYASTEQSQVVRKTVRPREDACFKDGFGDMRMSFRADVLAGNVAQVLVLKEYPDLPALVAGFAIDPADEGQRLAQLNAAEVFGRCVVQRDPASAMALFASRPGTREEAQAVRSLRDDLGPCLAAGSKITINEMFLRNSMGVAAYRFAQQIQPRGDTSGGGR